MKNQTETNAMTSEEASEYNRAIVDGHYATAVMISREAGDKNAESAARRRINKQASRLLPR